MIGPQCAQARLDTAPQIGNAEHSKSRLSGNRLWYEPLQGRNFSSDTRSLVVYSLAQRITPGEDARLARQHNLVAMAGHQFAKQIFRFAIAIKPGRIKVGNPGVRWQFPITARSPCECGLHIVGRSQTRAAALPGPKRSSHRTRWQTNAPRKIAVIFLTPLTHYTPGPPGGGNATVCRPSGSGPGECINVGGDRRACCGDRARELSTRSNVRAGTMPSS